VRAQRLLLTILLPHLAI